MSSIKQIRSFIMVADLKSFTNAAEAMFMTQPAVSAQIKSLEENLGLALIERSDKRVQLTEAGKHFYREAKEILVIYDRAIETMEDFKGLQRGKLALGASTIPGEYLMPKFIGEFHKEYPGIHISLKIGDTSLIVDYLYDRKIDLGVVGARVDSSNVEFIPFLQAGSTISDTITQEDLLTAKIITRETGSGTRIALKESLGEHGINETDLNIVMELGSTQAVITGVAADLGIGFVSQWAAEASIRAGMTKQVKVQGLDLHRELFVVYMRNATVTRARDVFLQFLLGESLLK